MNIPSDPAILLSFINTKLRDFYPDLHSLCSDLGVEQEDIRSSLASIDYEYSPEQNQFI